MTPAPRRILVIRRDNIGDLVCTLPLIRNLRMHYPQAWIGALVTGYNAEVLHGNTDLDAVFAYRKLKHLAHGESALRAMLERLQQLWRLRRLGIDTALLPASGPQPSARRMARLIGARRILLQDDLAPAGVDGHEVTRTAHLLKAFDLPHTDMPSASIAPRPELVARMRQLFGARPSGPLLGLHISARKASQRWPAERFVALIQQLHATAPDMHFALFWAPGDENNPLHPGDDRKAKAILDACATLPVTPLPTHTLGELIAGLSLVDSLVCADGGHMHLAAALGKPIVALFGKSDATRWHPWGVPHRILQPASQDVADVGVASVVEALNALRKP